MQDNTDPWVPETSKDKAMNWLTFIVFLSIWLPFMGVLAGLGYWTFTWSAGL
jgi:hypothetical protein